MMKLKSYVFLTLSLTIALFSAAHFVTPGERQIGSSIAATDQFQNLLDQYCDLKAQETTAEKERTNTLNQIKQNDDEQARLKSEQEEHRQASKKPAPKSKADSLATDPRKLDSLIKQKTNRIAQLKEINQTLAKRKDEIENELKQKKADFERSRDLLKTHASNLRGGRSFKYCGVRYHAFIADLDSQQVQTHLFIKEKQNFYTLGAVKKHLEQQKIVPLMITNAGMFTPSHRPQGLYIDDKNNYPVDTTRGNPDVNFYMKPNGVFYIDENNTAHIKETLEYAKDNLAGKIKAKVATQSGPMLISKGIIHKNFKPGSANTKIRSGVGKISDKKIIFAATIDESNFYDFAGFFQDVFGCKDALFLDGAISKMYLRNVSSNVDGHFGPFISVSKKTEK